MSRPEPARGAGPTGRGRCVPPRYGRYLWLLAIVIIVLLTINGSLTKSAIQTGVRPGRVIPPFALPLANGDVTGDANVATRPNQGSAGKTPACAVRGAGILNVCELYERGPLVLALFVDASSCPAVLSSMQALAPANPGVRFAAVAIKGQRPQLLKLIAQRGLTDVQVGFDSDGALASLYQVVSCPQVTFVLPGGVAQSKPLLTTPSTPALSVRVNELVAAARARGWRPPRDEKAIASQARRRRVTAPGAAGGCPPRCRRPRPRPIRRPRRRRSTPASSADERFEPALGWRAREVQEELPQLQMLVADVQVARRGAVTARSPRDIQARLRQLSNRYRGARAVGVRREPVPSAYRAFYRQIGLDPDVVRTPLEGVVLERMLHGGFVSEGLLADVLLIALVDTGVPVWALDAGSVDGPLGIRASREGEPLGRSPDRPGAARRQARDRRRLDGAGDALRRARARARAGRGDPPPAPVRDPGLWRADALCRRDAVELPRGAWGRLTGAATALLAPAAGACGKRWRGGRAVGRIVSPHTRRSHGVSQQEQPVVDRRVAADAQIDELAARRSLRAQVARLERELAAIVADGFPHILPPTGASSRRQREIFPGAAGADAGARLLDLAELERVRDELAGRLQELRARVAERLEHERRARQLLDEMRLEPGRHKFRRLAVRDLGQGSCGVWEVRPRLGLIGMLAGWWQLKLSSGCPLATGRARGAAPLDSVASASERELSVRAAPLCSSEASVRRWRSVIDPTVFFSDIGIWARNLRQRVWPQRRWLISRSATAMLCASQGQRRITSPTSSSPTATLRLSSARARRTLLARSSARMYWGPVGAIVAVAFMSVASSGCHREALAAGNILA